MTPAQEYRSVLADVEKLAERIPTVLADHAKRQDASPQYWCHVGDLKKARLDLIHVLAFLGDLDSREEEQFVAKGGDSLMTADKIERPECVKDEHLLFLDGLRESGATNMFGARPYLLEMYPGLGRANASAVLSFWMKTFAKRHPRTKETPR